MRRPLTANELIVLRSSTQWSRWYMGVSIPRTLFSARINQGSFTYPLATLTFDGGSGVDVPAHATIYVGTSAGAWDVGKLRLREILYAAASGTVKVCEIGDTAYDLANDLYLTFVEDFRPWPRYHKYDAANDRWLADYEIPYDTTTPGLDNYHANDQLGPLARMGCAAVGFLEGNRCRLRYVGEDSTSCSIGDSLSLHQWGFPDGGTSFSTGTSASPVIRTYTTAYPHGRYHSLITRETNSLKYHTGRRLTFVFERTGPNAPIPIVLENISMGYANGGAKARVRILNNSLPESVLPPDAHVVIFNETFYGNWWKVYPDESDVAWLKVGTQVLGLSSGVVGTIQQVLNDTLCYYLRIEPLKANGNREGRWYTPGEQAMLVDDVLGVGNTYLNAPTIGGNNLYRENVVLEGFIEKETLRINPQTQAVVELEVATADMLLKKMRNYPTTRANRSTTPDFRWEDFKSMTMDRVSIAYTKWLSTLSIMCDVWWYGGPPTDAIVKYIDFTEDYMHSQLQGVWERTTFGTMTFSAQGDLHFEMNAQIDNTVRDSLPLVMRVTPNDRLGSMEVDRWWDRKCAQISLYAVAYRTPLGSRSPGDPHDYLGELGEYRAGLSCTNQTVLNQWAGNYRAWKNYALGAQPRLRGLWFIDPVPQAHFQVPLTLDETNQRFRWLNTDQFILRQAEIEVRGPVCTTTATFEKQTSGVPGTNIVIANESPVEVKPTEPPKPQEPPRPNYGNAKAVWIGMVSGYVFVSSDYFNGGQPTWTRSTQAPINFMFNFEMFANGSACFFAGNSSADGKSSIYQCTDPVNGGWTRILATGDSFPGGTITDFFGSGIGRVRAMGNKLYCSAYQGSSNIWWGGTYDLSTGWTWVNCGAHGLRPQYVMGAMAETNILKAGNGATIATWQQSGGFGESSGNLWKNQIGGHWYLDRGLNGGADYAYTFRDITAGVDVIPLHTFEVAGTAEGYLPRAQPTGALGGPQVYVTGYTDNGLWLSEDGAAFNKVATWGFGRVYDTKYAGGGSLVWILNTMPLNGVPTRLYGRDGSVLFDMTGNFWALNNQTQCVGSGVVYV